MSTGRNHHILDDRLRRKEDRIGTLHAIDIVDLASLAIEFHNRHRSLSVSLKTLSDNFQSIIIAAIISPEQALGHFLLGSIKEQDPLDIGSVADVGLPTCDIVHISGKTINQETGLCFC